MDMCPIAVACQLLSTRQACIAQIEVNGEQQVRLGVRLRLPISNAPSFERVRAPDQLRRRRR